jgi:hypothetical protein
MRELRAVHADFCSSEPISFPKQCDKQSSDADPPKSANCFAA